MTTPELPDTPAPVMPQTLPERRQGAWRRPAAVIAVVALALLGWQWFETRNRLAAVEEELSKRLAESDAVAKESRVIARNAVEAQAAMQAKLGGLEAQLAELQGQQGALDMLYRELSKSSDERMLAEAEQAVAIAAQQLRLAGNVETALIALTGIETRLTRAGGTRFTALHKLIVRDIERLKTLPGTDVPMLSTRLEAVIAAVDTLPLAYERRPKPTTATESKSDTMADPGFMKALALDWWNELRQLIRVERIDSPGHADPALLSPTQSFFLRENLKLRLVNARLSLLTRDGRGFKEDMTQSALWLERYFDASAKGVQSSLATLRALQATDIGAELPTLDETLNAVRNFKLAGARK